MTRDEQIATLRVIADAASLGLSGSEAMAARSGAINAALILAGANGVYPNLNSRVVFTRRDGTECSFDAWLAHDAGVLLSSGGAK